MTTRAITNHDDIIDSRDIIARIQELESEMETFLYDANEANEPNPQQEWDESDEGQELKALKALEEEASGYGDWDYGAMLIHDEHFVKYAEEFAWEIGRTEKEVQWPYTHIDWEAAAEDLKQDYTEVDFDGETYWIRS